jgi:hypothetical protein
MFSSGSQNGAGGQIVKKKNIIDGGHDVPNHLGVLGAKSQRSVYPFDDPSTAQYTHGSGGKASALVSEYSGLILSMYLLCIDLSDIYRLDRLRYFGTTSVPLRRMPKAMSGLRMYSEESLFEVSHSICGIRLRSRKIGKVSFDTRV